MKWNFSAGFNDKDQLKKEAIQDRTNLLNTLSKTMPADEQLQVLICTDEVQGLLPPLQPLCNFRRLSAYEEGVGQPADVGASTLQHLQRAMGTFIAESVFFVLLSIHSRISTPALSREVADSARHIKSIQKLPAPLTETPFDCHVANDFPMVTLAALSDAAYLGQYGRPL